MLSLPGKPVRVVIVALFAGILAGCGGGESDDRPDRTPVSGSVSIGGVPVTGAIVVFSPANEGSGRGATGITDDSGNFALGTFEKADGAVPGDYIVLVSKLEQTTAEAAGPVNEDDPNYDGAPAEEENAGPAVEVKTLVPAKFGKRESSTLRATVGDDAVEGLPFDLAG
ncbi:MAG: hypothetical protein ACI8P0_000520 [Planctomycetaceae bacterium]|jgi:hypothetical protein